MKYYISVLIAFSLALGSCNRNNDLPTETQLSIMESYLPVSAQFQKSDKEFVESIKEFVYKNCIINDLSELPDDPLGFSPAYSHINFNEYTLLIFYEIHRWNIDSYRNRYYRNNIEGTNNWIVYIGTSTTPDDEMVDRYYFTRFAILVKKIPANIDVKFWYSLQSLNSDWDS